MTHSNGFPRGTAAPLARAAVRPQRLALASALLGALLGAVAGPALGSTGSTGATGSTVAADDAGLALHAAAPAASAPSHRNTKAAPKPARRLVAAPAASGASTPATGEAPAPIVNSQLDAALFYELLMAEFARHQGDTGDAVELTLDAARRTKEDGVFLRAVEIAAEAGAGDKALAITRVWRQALPRSTEALRTQLQFLFAMERQSETVEPLKALLGLIPPADRSGLIASLPRMVQRARDKTAATQAVQSVLGPLAEEPATRTAAHVALGRLRLGVGQPLQALEHVRAAQQAEPGAVGPALLALDLAKLPGMTGVGERGADVLVQRYLATPGAEPLLRQAWAADLSGRRLVDEAAAQQRLVVAGMPVQASSWLMLAELELDRREPGAAEQALLRVLDLQAAPSEAGDAAGTLGGAIPPDSDAALNQVNPARVYLLLAAAAQMRRDTEGEARWLARIDSASQDASVIQARASLLARQGKLAEARSLLHTLPDGSAEARRERTLVEVQLLRSQRAFDEARQVLADTNTRFPGDTVLMYEQAMLAERLSRVDEMEALLRAVLQIEPDNAQALNALGYSLADRRLRLDEAQQLVARAHELAPADPFITDSLGWVEFRRGNFEAATRWLRAAFQTRRDVEIAAHLGEALWAQGRRDEAIAIWREAESREADNEVLTETLRRLRPAP